MDVCPAGRVPPRVTSAVDAAAQTWYAVVPAGGTRAGGSCPPRAPWGGSPTGTARTTPANGRIDGSRGRASVGIIIGNRELEYLLII